MARGRGGMRFDDAGGLGAESRRRFLTIELPMRVLGELLHHTP